MKLGDFVHADGSVGRLVRMDGNSATVEFFDAPVTDGLVHVEVPASDVRPVLLEQQTRVWWDDAGQWRVGRVLATPDWNTDAYLVAFTGGRNEELPAGDLHVQWSRPLRKPSRLLAARVAEARFFHSTRSAFSHEVLRHRAAAEGFTGIVSSSIRLHRHQVTAARRVLLDPVRRYLLADEVGLGKTVEAGMVIRQTMLERRGARVQVLVPEVLVAQWEDELAEKFDVQGLNGGYVDVAAHADAAEIALEDATMFDLVVVDEAHRLTDPLGSPALYDAVERIALTSPALLLLSATPVRSNEGLFLRLLHLLDPANYRLDEIEAFQRRVAHRDAIGGAVSLLADDSPAYLMGEAIETLAATFPDDAELEELLQVLSAALDADDEGGDDQWEALRVAARRVRSYVSESYRIHRRLIRTRRNERLREEFPVRGRTLSEAGPIVDVDGRRPGIVQALDSFRIAFADAGDLGLDVLRTVAARCCAATPALESLCVALGGGTVDDLAAEEIGPVAALCQHPIGQVLRADLREALSGHHEADGRIDAMATWAWAHVNKGKVAACSSFTSVARAAAARMEERYGAHRVAVLLADMTAAERERQLDRARTDPNCVLLVCDGIAEEGLNLQFATDVLHLDVPWSANRLEQRIGRFDRFAVGGVLTPIRSTIVLDEPELDRITGAWIRLLDEGMAIFSESSATLQYVLPEREVEALGAIVGSGFGGLGATVERVRDELAQLRRNIEGQDLLDELEDSEDDRRFFDRLVSIDDAAGGLRRATEGWIGKALNLGGTQVDGALRFSVSKKNPPLLTATDVQSLGYDVFSRGYAAKRSDAGTRGRVVLRPGQPLIDGAQRLCELGSRGVTFAGVLAHAGIAPGTPAIPAFFFDVLVEPAMPAELAEDDPRWGLVRSLAWRHLPPAIHATWHAPGRAEPPPEFQRLLASKSEELAEDGERFRELTEGFDWPRTCELAEERALDIALARTRDGGGIDEALAGLETAEAHWVARWAIRHRSMGDDTEEDDLDGSFELARRAIAEPSVRTDTCGVVFLVPAR